MSDYSISAEHGNTLSVQHEWAMVDDVTIVCTSWIVDNLGVPCLCLRDGRHWLDIIRDRGVASNWPEHERRMTEQEHAAYLNSVIAGAKRA